MPAVRRDRTGRGLLVPAVLVAGSFAPDMPFYAASVLPGGMEFAAVTGALAGVFTVDVLMSWALVGLWLLVREPLLPLLRRGRRGRPAVLLHCGAPRARAGAVTVVWWYVSAVPGALTHVVWDAFTHQGRWGDAAGSGHRAGPGGGCAAVLAAAVRLVRGGRGRARGVRRACAAACVGRGGGGDARAARAACAARAGPIAGLRGNRRLCGGRGGAAGVAPPGAYGAPERPWDLVPPCASGRAAQRASRRRALTGRRSGRGIWYRPVLRDGRRAGPWCGAVRRRAQGVASGPGSGWSG
ncbi:DUF4184 family protein [Streptomyces puniciscabiei]|uniref:DUF4184 family protein n=1 Tax=Streptomyces puniciscabiei TaxID=164348 RepID=UPI003789943D